MEVPQARPTNCDMLVYLLFNFPALLSPFSSVFLNQDFDTEENSLALSNLFPFIHDVPLSLVCENGTIWAPSLGMWGNKISGGWNSHRQYLLAVIRQYAFFFGFSCVSFFRTSMGGNFRRQDLLVICQCAFFLASPTFPFPFSYTPGRNSRRQDLLAVIRQCAFFWLLLRFFLPFSYSCVSRRLDSGRPPQRTALRQRKDQILPSQSFALFLGVARVRSNFLTEIVRKRFGKKDFLYLFVLFQSSRLLLIGPWTASRWWRNPQASPSGAALVCSERGFLFVRLPCHFGWLGVTGFV